MQLFLLHLEYRDAASESMILTFPSSFLVYSVKRKDKGFSAMIENREYLMALLLPTWKSVGIYSSISRFSVIYIFSNVYF